MTTAHDCCNRMCDQTALRSWGGRWYCAIHYRIKQMRDAARRDKKVCPSPEEMAGLVDGIVKGGMKCRLCERKMNWLRKDGQSTCVTLQHNRDGSVSLICLRCNVQHGQLPGDLFYDVPAGHKWCSGCEQILALESFYPSRTIRQGVCTRCKSCTLLANRRRKTRATA